MGDENDFALAMNMAMPFAYFIFLESHSFRKKLLYLSAVGLFIAANVASFSRGGFVGLIFVIAYCWSKTPRKFLATVLITMIVGVLLFFATATYWDEMRTIKQESIYQGTGEDRWYLWKVAWRMFLDHPVIGVGPDNFGVEFPSYVLPDDSNSFYVGNPFRGWGRVSHSLYFTVIPELGLIGIFLFSAMLYHAQKDKRWVLNLETRPNASPRKKP